MFTRRCASSRARSSATKRNPYRIAQKLFAAVDRIPWAGAREYSTISNISDYALHAGHARLRPADAAADDAAAAQRHSGALAVGLGLLRRRLRQHARLGLAVPRALRLGADGRDLRPPEVRRSADRWFYLGGLDAYRIAFNDDFSQPFVPAKQHFRSDTVDSQRGEVEWHGGNLYFDQWDYDFEAQVLTAPTMTQPSSTGSRESQYA